MIKKSILILLCGVLGISANTDTKNYASVGTNTVKTEIAVPVYTIASDFEKAGLFYDGLTGTAGDANDINGRYGPFGGNGPFITAEKAYSGKQSVKLIRGGSELSVFTAKKIPDDKDCCAEVWIYRTKNSSFVLYTRNRNASDSAGIYVLDNGGVRLRNFKGSPAWQTTQLSIPVEKWILLRVYTLRGKGKFYAAISEDRKTETVSDIKSDINEAGETYMIRIIPQSPEGNITYIDNISLYYK